MELRTPSRTCTSIVPLAEAMDRSAVLQDPAKADGIMYLASSTALFYMADDEHNSHQEAPRT